MKVVKLFAKLVEIDFYRFVVDIGKHNIQYVWGIVRIDIFRDQPEKTNVQINTILDNFVGCCWTSMADTFTTVNSYWNNSNQNKTPGFVEIYITFS